MAEYDDFQNLLDVHEILNKESKETIEESLGELRCDLQALYYNENRESDDTRRKKIIQLVDEIKYSGYREGFKDAVKQMDIIVKKIKTRREQIEKENR